MKEFEDLKIEVKAELYSLWIRFKEKEMSCSAAEDEAVEYDLMVESTVRENTLDTIIHYYLGKDYPEDKLKTYFYNYWVNHRFALEYED